MTIHKGYSDGPEGQIHWRMMNAAEDAGMPDLYCFSPAPFSSIAYSAIMPYLAIGGRAIAPDYPGQGGSDGVSPTPSIEAYADSMCAVIDALSGDRPVHLTGFHSGCLVAVDVALLLPDQATRLALVDVPAFDPDTRAKYLPMVGAPFEPSHAMDSQQKAWERAVSSRQETQPLARSLEMFADQVAAGDRQNATFHAAFTYDLEAKFAALDTSTTIIATQSMLLEPTRRAARLIPGARLIEQLDIQRSVLDENAETSAAIIRDALDCQVSP